jgi:hypothetical protein
MVHKCWIDGTDMEYKGDGLHVCPKCGWYKQINVNIVLPTGHKIKLTDAGPVTIGPNGTPS